MFQEILSILYSLHRFCGIWLYENLGPYNNALYGIDCIEWLTSNGLNQTAKQPIMLCNIFFCYTYMTTIISYNTGVQNIGHTFLRPKVHLARPSSFFTMTLFGLERGMAKFCPPSCTHRK